MCTVKDLLYLSLSDSSSTDICLDNVLLISVSYQSATILDLKDTVLFLFQSSCKYLQCKTEVNLTRSQMTSSSTLFFQERNS